MKSVLAARAARLGGLRSLGEGQGGLFTRGQTVAAGISDQMLARYLGARRIRRVAWGVYRLAGDRGGYERVRAAWLQLDGSHTNRHGVGEWPAGVVSHLAGAALFDLCLEPAQLTFTVPIARRSRRHDVRIVTAPMARGEWTWWEGLPVARPPRIAVDLLADDHDVGEVARLVERSLQLGLTSPDEVGGALASIDHLLNHLLNHNRELAFLGQLADAATDGSVASAPQASLRDPLTWEHSPNGGQGTRGDYPPDWPQWPPSYVSARRVAASAWGSAGSTWATAAKSVIAIPPAPFAVGCTSRLLT